MITICVDWSKFKSISRLIGSLQMGPGFGFGDWKLASDKPRYSEGLSALSELAPSMVRYQGWHNRPDLTVALKDSNGADPDWDFSKIDPPFMDFLFANRGRPFILNFSALPTSARSPDSIADYFGKFAAWYIKGGFDDPPGRQHLSGHRLHIPLWEVLNEPDYEPAMSPADYTETYDVIVEAVRKVSPNTQFVGLALCSTLSDPQFTTHFLNPRNHRADIPLDYVSYHFYAMYTPQIARRDQVAAVFNQADGFIDSLRYVCAIRDSLSPATGLMVTEIGTMNQGARGLQPEEVRFAVQLSAAMYAYLYARLAVLGVIAAHVSGLVAVQPDQIWQELAMIEWESGQPNSRYWTLKLLIEEFPPDSELVETRNFDLPPYHLPPAVLDLMTRRAPIYAQAFVTAQGVRKVLLINRSDSAVSLELNAGSAMRWRVVDQDANNGQTQLRSPDHPFVLGPLAIASVTVEDH
ncbi:MAG TPA: hypothetical protein VIY90_18975 [Steroidobacteraceae bacterium]